MTVQSPYRFVPLSKLVVLPEWGHEASHDVPFEDGVCGELSLTLTTHSRLSVGGEQIASSAAAPGQIHFFRTPDSKLAIPGSTIKGLLRNVLEIATFSRFKQVEDQKLGVRDISESDNFYATEIVSTPVNAGWMTFEDGSWKIRPCQFARVHQADLINEFGVSYREWRTLGSVEKRYTKINIDRTIRFDDDGLLHRKYMLARIAANGQYSGNAVVTGQPGRFYDENDQTQPRGAKKYEFIFYNSESDSLEVQASVMSGFYRIHEKSDEWKYWLRKLNGNHLAKGIPVFYHQNQDQSIRSLGLAMMYKLPYSNSIHDAISHTSDVHLKEDMPDFADLIFGYLKELDTGGLRGRVNFGLALTDETKTSLTPTSVLSSPNPTYYPMYVRQSSAGEFNQLMQPQSELSGWKRYQVKDVRFPTLSPLVLQNKKVQVVLETVDASVEFQGKLRFHNLRPIELGALLWSLDFGGQESLRHSLGTGKPYGLGQLSIKVCKSRLRRNDQQPTAEFSAFSNACVQEFRAYMDGIFKQAGASGTWEQSGPIEALKYYAKSVGSASGYDYLAEPKGFMDLRKAKFLPDFKKEFHSYRPISAKVASVAETQRILDEINKHLAKKTDKALANEIFLLDEIEKPKGAFPLPEDKKAVAVYLKAQFQQQGEWVELSSADKKERKKYDKTQRIKRLL